MAIEDFLKGQLQRIDAALGNLADADTLLDIAEEGGQIVAERRAEVAASFASLDAQKQAILNRFPSLAAPEAEE